MRISSINIEEIRKNISEAVGQKDVVGYNSVYPTGENFSALDIDGKQKSINNIREAGIIDKPEELTNMQIKFENSMSDPSSRKGNIVDRPDSNKTISIENDSDSSLENIRKGRILKNFSKEYSFLGFDSLDAKNTGIFHKTYEEDKLSELEPNNKSFEEAEVIDYLKNKNNFNKQVGRIHVKPVAGTLAFDIPFEYSPQISSEQVNASYVSEKLMNKIGQFFVYTGTMLSQINLTLEYEALSPDSYEEIAKDNLGKQFATDTWEYYWTNRRINEMEYKIRSLVLPDVTNSSSSIIVPPIIEIILANPGARVRDLYRYPDNVGRSAGKKYLSVTKTLGDMDIYKKYIVTSVQIEYKNKDVQYASYYGRNIASDDLLGIEPNIAPLSYRRGFKASIQCTEITANFLDVAPDYAAYYDAWKSDLGKMSADSTMSRVSSWAENYKGPTNMTLEDRRILQLGTLESKISRLNADLDEYFRQAASIAKLYVHGESGEWMKKFLSDKPESPFEYMDPTKRYFNIKLNADYEDKNDYSSERVNRLIRADSQDLTDHIANITINSEIKDNEYLKELGLNSLPIKTSEEKNYNDVSCIVLENTVKHVIDDIEPNKIFVNVNPPVEETEINNIVSEILSENNITSSETTPIDDMEVMAFPKEPKDLVKKLIKLQRQAIKNISNNQKECSRRFSEGPTHPDLSNYNIYLDKIQAEGSSETIESLEKINIFEKDFDIKLEELYNKVKEYILNEPNFGIEDIFEEVTIPIPLGSDMSFINDNVPLRNLPSEVIKDMLYMAETINDLEAHLVNTNGILTVELKYSGKEEFSGNETVEIKNPKDIDDNYFINKLPKSIRDELKLLSNDKDLIVNIKSIEGGLLQVEVGYNENSEFSGNERISINSPSDIDGNRSLNKLPSSVKDELKKLESPSNINIISKDGILTMKVEYEK